MCQTKTNSAMETKSVRRAAIVPLLLFCISGCDEPTAPEPDQYVTECDEGVVERSTSSEGESKEFFTSIVEHPASFEGGYPAFFRYIAQNIQYPSRCAETGGAVFISFIVERDGTVTNVEVIKSLGADFNQEAMRLIQNSPNWNPGEYLGRPVRQKMVVPIRFGSYR